MQLEEWLYDEGYDETPATYKDRLKSLEVLFEPIKRRVVEHRERPDALKARIDPVIVVIIVMGLILIVVIGSLVVCSRRRVKHSRSNYNYIRIKYLLVNFKDWLCRVFVNSRNWLCRLFVNARDALSLNNRENLNARTSNRNTRVNANELSRLRRRAFWQGNNR